MSVRSFFYISFVFILSSCIGMGAREPAPVVVYGVSSGVGSAGVHNVSGGDTIYSISNRYRLPMQDIVQVNNLQAPFRLFEGQRLKLPPPREYKVRYGDTLYGISRLFGANSSEIARLNNLRSPYTVREGQVLRLPSVAQPKQNYAQNNIMPASKPAAVESHVLKAPAGAEKVASKSVVKDGVPLPNEKPSAYVKPKEVKVSRVVTKTPKRASSKFMKPVNGRILSSYGAKQNGLHNDGINIEAARGTSVGAAENGVVVYAGNALKGSGNLVLIRHEDQWMTAYAHMDKITVSKGDIVKRGSQVGTVGSTGDVSLPQLHFEVRRGTQAMNPVKYME